MFKKSLLASLLAVVALMPVGAARAQHLSGDVNFSRTSSGDPVFGASGSYHVTVDLIDSVTNKYQVTITGNNDGHAFGVAAPDVAKNGVDLFTLSFFDGGNTQLTVRGDAGFAPTGSTTAYDGSLGPNGNKGDTGTAYGSTGGAWLTNIPFPGDATALQWSANSNAARGVSPHGGNSFTGTFYLAAGQGPISFVGVSLQDGNQQWSGTLTPEPGSLALLLPGLMPIGLMVRRRRSKR